MIKAYPQLLVKLIEMPLEESYRYPQGCRCGGLGSGKYVVAYTHLLTATWHKLWVNLIVYLGQVSISSSIKEQAAVVYRKALDKGLVRGRSISGVAAASLYAACRKSGAPRTLREISEASLVNRKDVARCYRLLLKEIDFHMPISDPLIYVSKIAEKNNISGKTQGAAIALLREARQKRVASGKDPMGMASAALYIACLQNSEKITQKDIAEAAGVTEVTVRNRYKMLKKQLNIDLPERA